MIKQLPITTDWQHLVITEEPCIVESWRGWVPASTVHTDDGHSGILYLCSYSLYKILKDKWLERGRSFKDMSFWLRKAYVGRYAPYEVSWTQPV